MLSEDIDEFLRKYNGTPAMGAPLGDQKRLDMFPPVTDFCCSNLFHLFV